jgi:hypothetical protein
VLVFVTIILSIDSSPLVAAHITAKFSDLSVEDNSLSNYNLSLKKAQRRRSCLFGIGAASQIPEAKGRRSFI